MTLLLIILFLRALLSRKRNPSVKFFSAAQKFENDGDFEEALINYESALTEIKKEKLSKNLRIRIVEKIKVLHTVINYQKNLFYLSKDVY